MQSRNQRRACVALLVAAAACREERVPDEPLPSYHTSMGALLRARCASCHSGAAPPGGFRADSYVGAVGCTDDGRRVSVPAEGSPPLLAVLARPDHASLLAEDEQRLLASWIALGTPSTTGGVHPGTFAEPRRPEGHARFLRDRRYRPLLDRDDADACSHCHAGAPLAPTTLPAAGATPCTTCHAESAGVFACSTCHGGAGRTYPTANACFRDARGPDAHAVHAEATALHGEGMACATCHPVPTAATLVSGAHLDGHVEVFFDYARAGRAATFDAATKACSGTCHDRGGAQPAPAWNAAPRGLGCGDCHASPPAGHYAGPCTTCHREANAAGSALTSARLHVSGRVDLGDGSGGCGACHGSGADPWPLTGAHRAHAAPASGAPVACETCHVVPGPGDRHPVGGRAKVRLAGLAVKGGAPATFDAASGACAATYCHAGRGATGGAPVWTGGSAPCGSCHALPPPPPHPAATTSCGEAALCHTGSLASPGVFTPAGRAAHVDGFVTRGL